MKKMEKQMPDAYAKIEGGGQYKGIRGTVYLYGTYEGTVLVAEVYGVPLELEEKAGFLGFHIHEGDSCTGTAADAFADTKGHYNPTGAEHPLHAGDLPPLLIHNGIAWMAVYSGRFYPEDVVGRTVVIHGMPDDFKTQPSGGSGEKIACGEIAAWEEAERIFV